MISFRRPGQSTLALTRPEVAIVGYAGRDAAAVEAHVRELAEHGVAPPTEVPNVWMVPAALLSQATTIDGRRGETSGEVEPVLVLAEEGWHLAVGSDHTDRKLEAESMEAAKRACAKVVSGACVGLERVGSDWDAVTLSSDICVRGEWIQYQRGTLADLRPLDWYQSRFAGRVGLVVFCGTVPTVGALRTDGEAFRGRLRLPDGDELVVEYEVATSG
ncbi:MAG: DUF2848 family protein [Microthrixaceae bacterium]